MKPVWLVYYPLRGTECLSKLEVCYSEKEALDFASLKAKFAIMKRTYFPQGGARPYDELYVIKAERLWPSDYSSLNAHTNLGFEQIEEIRKKGLVE